MITIRMTIIIIVIIAMIQERVTESIHCGKCLQNNQLINLSRKYQAERQATVPLFGTLTVQTECVKQEEE
jgi:hypothetical protein